MKTANKLKAAYADAVKAHTAAKRRYEADESPADSAIKRLLYTRMCRAQDAVTRLSHQLKG